MTFIPGLELRFSLPLGYFSSGSVMPRHAAVVLCTVVNVLLGMAVYALMPLIVRILRKWRWLDGKVWPRLEKKTKELSPLVEKYGVMGVALFIGIPLPGTGAYTGAACAYLLGLGQKRFWISNLCGVLMASALVTLVCVLLDFGIIAEDSFIKTLFIKTRGQGNF